MKVSLNWLKELVDYKLSPKELADKLSLISIGVKQFTDDFIELDLTYNRGDLLSLRGVAREVAAITGYQFSNKILPLQKNAKKTPVTIEDENLSVVQCVAKIEGLKVKKSPDDWVKKLEPSGIRSVNNITDITNLIMLEYGQPLHAFDQATVTQDTINIRVAKKGEEITTLDGKLRKLTPEDIVLADTEKPLDVAGIMGGKDTEIKESTTTILLSASMFNPIMVRNTSKRLGLSSEASKRFIHGLTKTNLLQALSAAIKMYQDLGGKLTAINLVGDFGEAKKTINLSIKKVNDLLGVKLDEETIINCLKKLNFTVSAPNIVTPPYFRQDCNIEEDLIEEVARIYGYEKIDGKPLDGEELKKLDQSLQKTIQELKKALMAAGLTEVQTYSFFSSQVLSALSHQLSDLIKIENPISSETEVLRDQLWLNLIEVVAKNVKKGFKDIAIFEIGKIYNLKNGKPEEKYHLSIALMNGTDNPIAELDLISRGVNLAHTGCVQKGCVQKSQIFHPKRITDSMAEVHPRILNKFGIEKRVAIMEVEIRNWFQNYSYGWVI